MTRVLPALHASRRQFEAGPAYSLKQAFPSQIRGLVLHSATGLNRLLL